MVYSLNYELNEESKVEIVVMEKTLTILKGMGMIFDINPSVRYTRNHKTDAENLASDWKTVGRDLRKSITVVNSDNPNIKFKAINFDLRKPMSERLNTSKFATLHEMEILNARRERK